MSNAQGNSKRIVKNTVILYLRMIVITIISLYTSRIILQLLGLSDFGIFSVVAGIIEFATIFTGSMTSATQRFLSFNLGKKDIQAFNKSFSSLYNIFFIFCSILFIVAIIAGLWMVQDILSIPETRKYAAIWVMVCAVFSFELTTLAIPYTSAIIAYERMDVYTYISIAEALGKLIAIYLLFSYNGDKLIAYAVATVLLRVLLNSAISIYCRCKLEGCIYHYIWDKQHIKELSSFSGWTLIGATSYTLMTQGHSILLNIFFGPVVNAAKGISDRIKNYSLMFSQNIFVAITPQLTKSYAAGNISYSRNLVMASSRLSFMLMIIVSAPLIMEMQPILAWWLGGEYVTHETAIFSINCLVFVLISTIEAPLTKAVQANGNVKNYEIVVGSVTLLFIPISHFLLMMDYNASSTFIAMNILYTAIIFYRVYKVKQLIDMSYMMYIKEVMIPIIIVCMSFGGMAWMLLKYGFSNVVLYVRIAIWLVAIFAIVFSFGINAKEKKLVTELIKARLS